MTDIDEANLVDTAGIAAMAKVEREQVTNRWTKRPDFPKPVINVSQKTRRWDINEVREWLRQPRRAAMSSSVVR
jgi:predicted DNA-binding transcriptional regulator AlpA